MSILKNHILLLKTQQNDSESTDKYADLFTANNYAVHQVKTLVFNYKNLPDLAEKISRPQDYSGIVLSSPRCVHAVRLAVKNCLSESWQCKENFVVGEATFEAAKSELNLVCRGSETGNAVNLAGLIITEKSVFTKPFLFPHGNLKTDTLYKHFKSEGLTLDETLVYETVANPFLQDEFAAVTNDFTVVPEFVVFFSPSGVQSTLDCIKKVPVDWALLKFIAIGPVTEEKMKVEGIPVGGVAEKPNPDAVLDVVLRLKSC